MNWKFKILWLENSLGIAIDQVNLKEKIAITPYYFWPQNDAWKQLKLEIDSKSWISKQEKITILNYISELMNYWKKNKKLNNPQNVTKQFQQIELIGVS